MASYIKHYALQNKSYKKLLDYSAQNNMLLFVNVQGLNTQVNEPVLSECCRLLILRLIMMVTDFFDNNVCLQCVSSNDIMIDPDYDNAPRLVSKNTVTMTAASIDRNLDELAGVISKGILSHHSVLPDDLNDLLILMSNGGHKNLEMIVVHSSLIPIENIRELFLRMHKEYFELKSSFPSHYALVSQGIVFPTDWEIKIQSNKHLTDMYNKRPAQKKKKKAGNLAAGTRNLRIHANVTQTQAKGKAQHQQQFSQGKQQKAVAQKWVTSTSSTASSSAAAPAGVTQLQANVTQTQIHANVTQTQAKGKQQKAVAQNLVTSTPSTASSSAAAPAGVQKLSWPKLKLGRYNAPGSDPCEEVIHFNRNCMVHGPELGLSQMDVEVMLKNIFKVIVCSFQKALHSVGRLNALKTWTLMPK